MNDPRQPVAPAGAPRPAGVPQPQHAPQQPQQPRVVQHPPQHAPAQHPPGMMPAGAPRPVIRPAGAPVGHPAQQPGIARPGVQPTAPSSNGGPAKIAAMPTMAPPSTNDEAIELVDDGDEVEQAAIHKKIKAFGPEATTRVHQWKRQPAQTGHGPVRVKSFHAKLSDQGLEYLDEAINNFIDEHPEVDVKFVTTNVGLLDGKIKDIAMVISVWY